MNARVDSLAALTFGTPIEGGFFAGYISTPDGTFGIAVAPKSGGEIEGKWLPKAKAIPGACSYYDCRDNTAAMAEAGSAIAKQILKLDLNGCTDWALPSRDVLELLYRNLKPTTRTNYADFRDGDNPSSLPVGYPYTEAMPAQTQSEAFRSGGAEALEPAWYWSSTQYSEAYAWIQGFSYGNQNCNDQNDECLARAVRRFKA